MLLLALFVILNFGTYVLTVSAEAEPCPAPNNVVVHPPPLPPSAPAPGAMYPAAETPTFPAADRSKYARPSTADVRGRRGSPKYRR